MGPRSLSQGKKSTTNTSDKLAKPVGNRLKKVGLKNAGVMRAC